MVRVSMSRNASLEEFFRSLAIKVVSSLCATLVVFVIKTIMSFI